MAQNSSGNSLAVLGNDTDVGGTLDVTSVAVTGAASHGSATANSDGTITYTPTAAYDGPDSFTYTVKDSLGAVSNAATVTITVTALPVATGQSVTTNKNIAKAITLAGTYTSGSGLTFALGTPSHGGLGSIGSPACGGGSCTESVTYTPTTGYTGADSFTFTVNDGTGTSTAATVNITVNAPPVANNDTFTVAQNSSGNSLAVLGNDTDVGGTLDVTSVAVTGAASHGSATANPDGTITYTPTAAYNGPDSFTYTVKDNLGAVSNAATVTITVTALPVATGQSVTTNKNIAKAITLAGTYTSGSGLTFALGTPSHGGLGSIGSPACGGGSCTESVTYTPTTGYTGADSFTFTVNDGTGTSTAATVNINVNTPPVANNDTFTVAQNSSGNSLAVLGNDNDVGGTLDVTTSQSPVRRPTAVPRQTPTAPSPIRPPLPTTGRTVSLTPSRIIWAPSPTPPPLPLPLSIRRPPPIPIPPPFSRTAQTML